MSTEPNQDAAIEAVEKPASPATAEPAAEAGTVSGAAPSQAPPNDTAKRAEADGPIAPAAAAIPAPLENQVRPAAPSDKAAERPVPPKAREAQPPRIVAAPLAKGAEHARDWGRRYGAHAAALAVALGVGYGLARSVPQPSPDNAYLLETTAGVRDSRQALARLGEDMTALKTAVERLKQGLDRPRADNAKLTQTLDRLDQGAKESAERLARLGEQVERVDRTTRDPARIASLTERLDRMEKQIVALAGSPRQVALVAPPAAQAQAPAHAAPAAPPPSPAPPLPPKPVVAVTSPDNVGQTGSVAKPTRLDGWVLRDVEDGYALVQSSAGRLREVTVGQSLPGGVQIEAVERRGRAWVVVTNKGLITAN